MDMMIAALGTLPFLATLWLLVVLGAADLEESGVKIAAALKGESSGEPTVGRVTVRLRTRSRSQQVRRAEPRLCAAA
jgi:hypothetical protein